MNNYDWTFSPDLPFVVETRTAADRPDGASKTQGLFVLLCLGGKADILVDGRRYHLEKNSQMVLLPSVTVESECVDDDFRMLRMGCAEVVFGEITSCFEPAFFNYMRTAPCVVLPDEEAVMIRHLASLVEWAIGDTGNSYRRQMVCNYLQCVLYHFYGRTRLHFQVKTGKWVNRKEELFKDYLSLVHRYCATERDVAFYADKMNITPRYLSTIVMKASGETAKDIIARHVVAEIKVRLKRTRLNVQELSSQMNFVNPSFFCRYFKKHTGMSPLQYRNEM